MDLGVINGPAKEAAKLTTPIKGLELSRRLFEQRGRPLLQQLNLFNVCAVGCFGGTSQNANLDDDWSRDYMWGPYLTFVK